MNAGLARLAAAVLLVALPLLSGLADQRAIRCAAAEVAPPGAVPPEQLRKRLKDPAAEVRLRTARALAEANDAEAIPVLIDLLAELPSEQRQPIEELLTHLAGEWAPSRHFAVDNAITRKVRRDAWASWWRHSDGAAVLAALEQHTLTTDKRRKLDDWVRQLGDAEFTVREEASRQLLALGRLALPRLRDAVKDSDAERARRAKMLIERIESGPDVRLPIVVLRLAAMRKPAGAVEALLAYVPFADDDERDEEARKALIVLARRGGKLDPALRRGLTESQAKVRAVAAEALIQGGGAEGRDAARKLLSDDAPSVRLRVAMALSRAGEHKGVTALIDLLPLLSAEESAQAEELLYQLPDDAAPELPDDKKKRRDAWAAWWKIHAERIDLTSRLSERPGLGYTLLCDNFSGRVFEIDRHGKERWVITGLNNPLDAVVLSENRVVIAEGNRVTQRDFKGNVRWQKTIANPVNVQRLSNGHIFIAAQNGALLEVDRTGKDFTTYSLPFQLVGAMRTHRGELVCIKRDGQCVLFDKHRQQIQSFPAGNGLNDTGGIHVCPNGHILIAKQDKGKVVMFDRDGKTVRELKAAGVATACCLANGNLLVTRHRPQYVYEVDRRGNVVWEYKGGDKRTVYRARRR